MRPNHGWVLSVAASMVLGGCCLQPSGEDAGAVDAGVPDSGHVMILNPCIIIDPTTVEFGTVEVNSTATKSLSLSNHCGIDVTVVVGNIKGTDPLLFATAPMSGTVLVLRDQETTSISVQYKPLVASPNEHTAYLSLSVCNSGAGCEPLVPLRGTPVSSCLIVTADWNAVEHSTLDFGSVIPGVSVEKFVTLADLCDAPIHLTADPQVLNTDSTGGNSPVGAFQQGAGFPTKNTTIPPGQSVQIPVVFTPPMIGKFIGEVDISTDDPGFANIVFPLKGSGGGAVISCAPSAIDFGLDAVGISATLSMVCTNVGSDVPGHPEANLFIPDPNSSDQGLAIEHGDYAFAPRFHSPFPTSGLAAGESTRIDVTYRPLTAGDDADTLIVSSNGTPGSLSHIPLSGSAKNLPPCDFQIEPNPILPLDFGHVAAGATAVSSFDIVNTGVDGCVVNAFQVIDGSAPAAFSLPDFVEGASSSQTIPGSSRLTVHVQFDPKSQGMFDGVILFTISNPNSPQALVDVEGTSP